MDFEENNLEIESSVDNQDNIGSDLKNNDNYFDNDDIKDDFL